MSEEPRRTEAAGSGEREKIAEEKDDISALFPRPETDERLGTPVLPEVPQVKFERPRTSAASGERSSDTINFGRLGQMSGSELRGAGIAATIGWSLALSIVLGTILGYLADRFLLGRPQIPWGLLIGFFLGVAAGFVNLIRAVNQINRDQK